MRTLTADTIIRVRTPRKTPAKKPLTGDTRIRLDRIIGLKEWHEQLIRDADKPGTVNHWKSDNKDHRKQSDGTWPVVGSSDDKIGNELPQKAVDIKKGEKPPIKIRTTETELKKIPTTKIKPHNYSDKQLKEMYKNFPDGVNKKDGTRVRFTHTPYGKMLGHQGYDFRKIVPQFRYIYENSEPIFDSNHRNTETRSDGSKHKQHNNIICFHHFLGKFKDEQEGQTYYIRFTTQEIKEPDPKKANNHMHSSFISDINLYKEEATNGRTHSDMDREAKPIRGFDKMLNQFFEEVKQNNSINDYAPKQLVQLILLC